MATQPNVNEALLEQQIKGYTDFDRELTRGAPVKTLMAGVKSRDLWQVKPDDLTVIEGFNPRTQDAVYFAGIEELANQMVKNGYMQDKPVSGYISKVEGKDVIVVNDGHRRLAAVKRAIELGAPIKTIPLVLKERDDDMAALTVSMLHANEGQPFNMYEKSVIAKRLKNYGWDNKTIAAEMGCTGAFVGELLTLAGAPQAIKELVKAGQMSGTLAVQTVKQHGERASEVARGSAAAAAAKGKGKTTAKDALTPAEQKARNARKLGAELYKAVTKLFNEKKVMDVISREVYEELDTLLTKIEKPKAKKAEKAPKPAKVKKVPLAKKVAKAASKKVVPIKTRAAKEKTNGADTEQRAAARGRVTRRGER